MKALRGVDLKISKGEFIVILGASGSGKTTLLNQIGGIDQPNQGSIFLKGHDISKYDEKDLTQHRKSNIGWIFQFHNLIPSLTSTENVQLALEMMGDTKDQKEKAIASLIAVGLEDQLDRFPSQLSGGQQQRVAIARALVKNPLIIVADEPTGNLDTKTSDNITNLMIGLCKKENITFCVVTHDPSMSKAADRLLLMEDGVLVDDRDRIEKYGIIGD